METEYWLSPVILYGRRSQAPRSLAEHCACYFLPSLYRIHIPANTLIRSLKPHIFRKDHSPPSLVNIVLKESAHYYPSAIVDDIVRPNHNFARTR